MLHIPGVLTPEQVTQFRQRLAQTDWVDGRASVGAQGAQVKRNRQLAEGSPLALELGEIVSRALMANPLFFAAVLPLRILPPFFNSYAGGEHYGLHIDGAIRTPKNGMLYMDMLNNLERIADHADNLATSVDANDEEGKRLLW